MNDQPIFGAPADAGVGKTESSDSALGASVAKAAAESDGTKSPVLASVTPEPVLAKPPVVFGGQFQDVEASSTVSEGETRNYTDESGRVTPAEIVASHPNGTVDILIDVSVGRIRRDGVPWRKEGMTGNFVE